ncbi:hypothetical protein F9C07_6688 [Aspergillus flavus]|uniref:Uncharacterized protein n=1 Tax=Aspergillus flavus (strain ATCC 200026 / FGSC A1120 / IAM 13836 / NRRL 3357 / JCM 12722 / SRRC 167) TaxID=332952 RepID=A0A7U2MH87_ASPFN|nr:hypothetical protein F9C07_6688 [Aspergillus flavus]
MISNIALQSNWMSYGRLHIVYYVQSASDRVDLADYPTAQIQSVHRMKNVSDYLTLMS